MEALILAGGQGKRLRSIVSDRPKPLADIDGRPFLYYLMSAMKQKGVTHFIIAVGYMGEKIINLIGNQFEGVPVTYSNEEEPLGTGGCIAKALPLLEKDEAFLMVNGDTLFNIDYGDLKLLHKTSSSELSIALLQAPESNRFGSVERDESLRVTMLPPHRAVKGAPCNGGLYLINPDVLINKLPVLKKFSFEDYWLPDLQSRDVKIYGFEMPGTFIDIGLPIDYNYIKKNKNIFLN